MPTGPEGPARTAYRFYASRDVTTPEGSRDVRVLQRFVTSRGESRVELA